MATCPSKVPAPTQSLCLLLRVSYAEPHWVRCFWVCCLGVVSCPSASWGGGGSPLVSSMRVPWGPRFSYNSCILSKEAPITGGDWDFILASRKIGTRLLSLNILYLHTRQVVIFLSQLLTEHKLMAFTFLGTVISSWFMMKKMFLSLLLCKGLFWFWLFMLKVPRFTALAKSAKNPSSKQHLSLGL